MRTVDLKSLIIGALLTGIVLISAGAAIIGNPVGTYQMVMTAYTTGRADSGLVVYHDVGVMNTRTGKFTILRQIGPTDLGSVGTIPNQLLDQ